MNRRVVLKAAAGLGAAAVAGLGTGTVPAGQRPRIAAAQEAEGTRARELVVADQADFTPDGDGWVTFRAEFPFWAVGIGWNTSVGRWPVVEMQISEDGESWGDVWNMAMRVKDDGKLADAGRQRDSVEGDRLFTDLLFAHGEEYIRFRTMDGDGNVVPQDTVAGLVITYIDPTDGPWEADRARTMARTSLTVANDDTNAPPQIITRAQWGADESLRFDTYGEIWPPEYETVSHAIVHHAAVNYGPDGYLAIRSIYYYHCVTQGWGDIGYNYLVDLNGNIYEGRVGGQNVIGGHAFEFAIGSSGICVMGDFQYKDVTNAAKAALITILAFVTRDLDTYAKSPFHEISDLPTICAHRDVNLTTCPGDFLYADLPEIRDQIAATLDAGDLDTGLPAGIVPGDQVKVQTDDGNALNMRSGGGTNYPTNGSIPDGTLLMVVGGPTTNSEGNWYQVDYKGTKGWVTADFLVVTPLPPPPVLEGEIPFGTNIRVTSETNIRRGPGTTYSIISTVARNTWAFIMAGPIKGNGYDWYQLRVQGVGDGWAYQNNLEIAPVNENPKAKFKVGDSVSAIRSTSIRIRPGAAQTVGSTVGAGTAMKITLAPIETTGGIWYGVQGSFGGGWVMESEIQASTPPPTGDLAAGDTVRVTETLNMRSSAGTGYGVIATLPVGTTGKVLDGPRSANGYTWYQIQTNYG
ncbi:MAG TPA: SH3 domain-containing protein, partial [Thermomicrobiales bacterium]|nr:SH3 domain-containing protein [Thermomicrobiales bacterium]